MKKLALTAAALVCALAFSFAAGAVSAAGADEEAAPEVTSEYASAYIYETVSLTSEYDGNEVAAWYVNGAKLEGSEGKASVEYTVSPSLGGKNIEFRAEYIIKTGGGETKTSGTKTLYVSPWTPLAVHGVTSPSDAFAGDEVTLSALIYNPTGRKFTLPLVWSAGGEPIPELSNAAYTPGTSEYTRETASYTLPDAFAGKVATFVCGLGRADDADAIKGASISINVKTKPTPPAEIGTVLVDCTINSATGIYDKMSLKGTPSVYAAAGTRAYYVNYSDTAAKVVIPYSDGTAATGWVDKSIVTVSTKNYTNYNDPTKAEKEVFVAEKGYKSDTDYLIWISLLYQKVNVFKKDASGAWELCFYTTCATGRNVTPTISGVFKYSAFRERWWFGTYYVAPVMIFNGGHALHSRTYTPSGDLLDATLGRPASHGCVRLLQESIDWLAETIPFGTTVVVY